MIDVRKSGLLLRAFSLSLFVLLLPVLAFAAVEGGALPQQAHGVGAQGEAGGAVIRQHFFGHAGRRQLHPVIEIMPRRALLIL